MKKALSVFLALTVLLSSAGFVCAEDTAATAIGSAEEFASLLTADTAGGSFILTADITLTEGFSGTFSGAFDGGNNTITIGTADAPAAQGVFASLGDGAVIENLVVDGAVSATADAGAIAGAVASSATVQLINCVNLAEVKSSASGKRIGGILGTAYGAASASFEKCVNYGTVRQDGWGNSAAGGMVGISTKTTLTDCVNYADIYGVYNAGGMVGWSYSEFTADSCANFGNVDSYYDNDNAGLLGTAQKSSKVNIASCYNSGTACSGFASKIGDSVTLDVTNCVNTGAVTNAIFTGAADEADNYCLEGSAANDNGATAKTSAELQQISLEGFKKQSDYLYPIPSGIAYIVEKELNPVAIGTASEFMKEITANPAGSYILTADIELSSIDYTPIASFNGVLNGGGYTVKLGNSATSGIFASVANAIVKNLSVTGTINCIGNGNGGNKGGIANTVDDGSYPTFINCNNYAEIRTESGNARAGGIVGSAYGSAVPILGISFISCKNFAYIHTGASTQTGGGIVGVAYNPTIINCENYGAVSSVQRAGGIIGWSYGVNEISYCSNFAEINSSSAQIAGGIVGAAATGVSGEISSCVNGGKAIGGIISAYGGKASIANCLNAGETVNAVADAASENITGCYYLADSGEDLTGSTAKTAEELKTLSLTDFSVPVGIYSLEYPVPVVTEVKTNTLTITATQGGSVAPAGELKVVYNQAVEVIATADNGYFISSADFNTLTSLTENNGVIITPSITDDSALEIVFGNISEIDLSDAAEILDVFYTTDDDFGWMGSTAAGSVIICGKAENVNPLTVEECGIILDVTNEMPEADFVCGATGTRTLKVDLENNRITQDGRYGIFIINNEYTECSTYQIRAYAKYSNGNTVYSGIDTISFEQIGVE